MIWIFIKKNLSVNILKGKVLKTRLLLIGEQKVGASIVKWGIGTIVMCLIPLIGLIFPIIALAKKNVDFPEFLSSLKTQIPYLSSAFFITYCTIFILIIFYIFIKIVKYERLEAGKGKLNLREYCTLSKDIFLPKSYS
ncbi:CYIR protein [Plasmodium cynomolgi strain B]|uniref:CYIR protein n=1 Tax=Plasmodium cynomolgi (strain B) TaxID=1120755 RepID=K6VKP5_PLACD|nr:CYIR protein [Plasmodium cynomolgi strain B]GAB69992.1 CYIR protein [Plasmodium cynomolgi strain B]